MPDIQQQRLRDLLREPRENLEVEIKSWIDIQNDNNDKALLAKAIIALANHGGGVIIIGLAETDAGFIEAAGRPENLSGYSSDVVNAVVNRYVEPPFHCQVLEVTSPVTELIYPIISVPGGHSSPIRSTRNSPVGTTTLRQNIYYTRRPGPQSDAPRTGQEWDALMRRCVTNSQGDLVNQIRRIITGASPEPEVSDDEEDALREWVDSSMQRWQELIDELPDDSPAKFPNGYYCTAYRLKSEVLVPSGLADFRTSLIEGVARYTGWPPFWVPTREAIAAYNHNGCIECWLGRDGQFEDAAHSDFWRARPDGYFFLIRGYQEDTTDFPTTENGQGFEITLPTWRLGEVLLHAESMARVLQIPEATAMFNVKWTGLSGRELVVSRNSNRVLFENSRAVQDIFEREFSVRADVITDELPEIVQESMTPLYELFDFFSLPATLVPEELQRLKLRQYT